MYLFHAPLLTFFTKNIGGCFSSKIYQYITVAITVSSLVACVSGSVCRRHFGYKNYLYITMVIPKSVYSTFFDQFCRVLTHGVGSSSNNLPATHSGASKIEWELILYHKMDKKRAVLYKITSHSILEAPECVAG